MKTLYVALIRPTNYDDEGFLVQWEKAYTPSNSLACVYSLFKQLADKKSLGNDVNIIIHTYDESHTDVPVKQIIKHQKRDDTFVLIGLAKAVLDPSVQVGAYSIIDGNVHIGANCIIDNHVRIYSGTTMGENNQVYQGAFLGCEPQVIHSDKNIPAQLTIGSNNIFREGANVSAGNLNATGTIIGNHNYFMGCFHVGHDCTLGDYNIFAHGAVLAGHVDVGNHAIISGSAAVHQFCRIGDYSITAGCSKIVKDVPPYATADGNPATLIGINIVGLRRSGFDSEKISSIRNYYKMLYKSKMNLTQALACLEKEAKSIELNNILNFYKQSERGVTRHR